jgi:glucose/arabinose dehydrogenase
MNARRVLTISLVVIAALVLALAVVVFVVGPGQLLQLGHKQLPDVPASTTLPLPTAAPTSQGTVLPAATPIATPGAIGATALPDITAVPTRIVPPAEPISLPSGFGISVFASGLRGPRMMAVGPDGEIYVAERGAGRIVCLPDRDDDGVADGVEIVAADLNAPSSIAFFEDGSLYVAETTRVLRLSAPDEGGVYQEREVIVDGLPEGGHTTRTVLFSPDWSTLYVSIGSSCNVCVEEDGRRAAIVRYNPDGSGERVYATGLRNAVGITIRPGTSELWATNNGRDWLGDDLPPETIYVVREGSDAGWPLCHSGRIVDPDFGGAGACVGVLPPAVEMQAHSAPLGLAFYDGEQFPEEYRGDLFVAFHGSWNRSEPTGYKVVRVSMREGGPSGPVDDFATGWLREDGSNWGRPVDIVVATDGSLIISEDGQGTIYRVFYGG